MQDVDYTGNTSIAMHGNQPNIEFIPASYLYRFIIDYKNGLSELQDRIKHDPAEREGFLSWAKIFYGEEYNPARRIADRKKPREAVPRRKE